VPALLLASGHLAGQAWVEKRLDRLAAATDPEERAAASRDLFRARILVDPGRLEERWDGADAQTRGILSALHATLTGRSIEERRSD
jgi:hypothetical protein